MLLSKAKPSSIRIGGGEVVSGLRSGRAITHSRYSGPLWVKLMALAMIPLVAAATLAGVFVQDRLSHTRSTTHIAEMAGLADQAGLMSDHTEFMAYILLAEAGLKPLAGQVPATEQLLGADERLLGQYLQQDLASVQTGGSRDATLRPLAAQLESLLDQQTSRPSANLADLYSGFEELGPQLYAVSARAMASIGAMAVGVTGSANLGAEIQDVNALIVLNTDLDNILGTIFQEVPAPLGTARAALEGGLVQQLARANADLSGVLDSGGSAILTRWEQSDLARYRALLTEAATWASAPPTSPISPAEISRMAPVADSYGLVATSADGQAFSTVAATATHLHDAAQTTMDLTLAAMAGLVILTLGLTFLLWRSIRRPMDALAVRASQISNGRLEVGDERGAREIVGVSGALNDAIRNLEQLRTQAEALGKGDLSSPVLSKPTPGRLGELLFESVLRATELQRELGYRATHDPLTGLLNRGEANEQLEAALVAANNGGYSIGVMFIDLDGFKRMNDHHGHAFGDRVLQVTAERLCGQIGPGDVACRLGGDEFLVIVNEACERSDIEQLGNRVLGALLEPIEVDPGEVSLAASIGIAISNPATPYSASQLLLEADVAVYKAKAAEGSRLQVFDDETRRERKANAEVEAELRLALEDDRLDLHFQPLVDVVSEEVWGFEALSRWSLPDRDVSPGEFIGVAEQSDLIIDLDRWVLNRACRSLASWVAEPVLGACAISVNISGRHLGRNLLLADVFHALRTHGVEPAKLVIEITETVLVGNTEAARAELTELRAAGVRVGLDDFGTGYSSIAQLSQVPADFLKIDREFLAPLTGLGDRDVIVGLLISAAHAMSMAVVAEGVECADQIDILRVLGCELAQGFEIAPALPDVDLVGWVCGWNARVGRPLGSPLALPLQSN